MPPLAISPSPLLFGTLTPGQTATKQLVLTAKQPFKLLSIASDYEAMEFKSAPGVVRKAHLVPITITAPEKPGDFQCTIEVQTDLPSSGKATCRARGTVRSDGAIDPTAAQRSNGLPR